MIVSYILQLHIARLFVLNMSAPAPAPAPAPQFRYDNTIQLLCDGIKKIYAEDMTTEIQVSWPLGCVIKHTKQPNGSWLVEYNGTTGYLPKNYNF